MIALSFGIAGGEGTLTERAYRLTVTSQKYVLRRQVLPQPPRGVREFTYFAYSLTNLSMPAVAGIGGLDTDGR
ncbi:hypothetical protein [Streptomyces sp. NPDC058247]|uniref:hypothetical protein n=1 Tax=Streptomyces sp. NPDC058247 TaxID=3346401 RepID=UPI0036E6BB58